MKNKVVERQRAVALLAAGRTLTDVARLTHVDRSSVARWAGKALHRHQLVLVPGWPRTHGPGAAYRPAKPKAYISHALERFGGDGQAVAPGVAETPRLPPPEVDLVRFHRLTFTYPVEQGPDPSRLKWEGSWSSSGTTFYRTTMPLGGYEGEEGATVVLAAGRRKRSIQVYFPSLWVPVSPGGDFPAVAGALIRSMAARARRWAVQSLGYHLGEAVLAAAPESATQDVGQRFLMKGVGYVRLTPEGEAWVDESPGEPELETRKPAILQAWVDLEHQPEALLAQILVRLERLERRVADLAEVQAQG